jgi:SAC3 family protein LENG8/THP3
MSHNDVLTVSFLQARGVTVSKPLRDWMTRVSFMARAQTDTAKRERYERWVLRTVEEAVKAPGGVAAVKWAAQSTIMPPDAPDKLPSWWPAAATEGAVATSPPTSGNAIRSALLEETLRRAPAELGPFVHQGFGLYDREVARGQRTYEQVSFIEMLNIAKSLFAKAPRPSQQPQPQQISALSHKEREVASPQPLPPVYAPQHASSPPAPQPHMAAGQRTRERPAAPPWQPPQQQHLQRQQKPLSAQKRSSPTTAAPYEPPVKRTHMTATATTTTTASEALTDISFFMQLAGTVEVAKPPPPVFVGRSTAMERAYTRYEPLVEDIRPLLVLKRAFAFVVARSKEVEETDGVKAGQKYLSDQLKGMRQDLRVQNIVQPFTVKVYERHARLSLEMGDIGEFNQCQAALKQFYESPLLAAHHTSEKEFFLYRVVYLTLSEQYDSLSTELINFTNAQLKGVTRPGMMELDKATVNSTLALCNACINGDTSTICRLLVDFPMEMCHLVRIYLQKLRIMWLKEILTAMKGMLAMRFLMASLGFTPVMGGTAAQQQTRAFWLDGSAEEAAARLTELFATLKISLPPDFTFEAEVLRTKQTGPNPNEHFPSLDAGSALKAVDEYLLYLGTRKDAGLG